MIMPSEQETQAQKQLKDSEKRSTGLVAGGRGATSGNSNEGYNSSGHKSSDRKTGLAQTDDHFSWRQVYRALEVRVFGHNDERKP